MKRLRNYSRCLLAALFVAVPGLTRAQEPPAVRKITLPSLDSQVQAQLIALDRRLNPVSTPSLAASLIAGLTAPTLAAFGPVLADPRNNENWDHLPEEYYRMAQESGDALVTLPEAKHVGSAWTSGQVRRLCHQRLTLLPRSALAWYRQRVDAEANALLEQGRQTRTPGPLRRLVEELFCSSVGDVALDLLGDLAFERGHFDEARHWWSLLAPVDSAGADRLRFPDPKVDVARVEAKQILAQIFAGRLDEAQLAITRYHRQHPTAQGDLAGDHGGYSAILQKTLNAFAQKPFEEPWSTFGGDATRNQPLAQGLPWHLWEDGPTWSVKLPSLAKSDTTYVDHLRLTRRAAFHPIIVQQQVLLADHRSVVSYHLLTGKELFRFDLKIAGLTDPGPGIDARVRLPRFTLSADHERAYVRLGAIAIGPKKVTDTDDASYLVCLDLTRPDQTKPRMLWHIKARADDKATIYFEGAPLVHDDRVYIALSKLTGRRIVTSIVCYDTRGRQHWLREVCDCPEFEENAKEPRHRHHLLTWTGGQIVYGSHAGALVAVNAWTGQPTWALRYPSRGALTGDFEPSPRDLAPCVYGEGYVIAAPLDADRLFCVDALTGKPKWELENIEIVHLLGVSQGRVFFTTRDGAQAVDLRTGNTAWMQPTAGSLPSLGRGLLGGNWLLWPTRDTALPYRALTQRGGEQVIDPSRLQTLPVGNLAFGQGCLAIAGLDELFLYAPANRVPMPPLDPRPQARIDTLHQQARRQASAGDMVPAARIYLELLEATKTHPQSADWRKLIEGRLQSLITSPERQRGDSSRPGENPVAGARGWSATFTDPRMPPTIRLSAWKQHSETASAEETIAIAKRVLHDPSLRQAWLPGPLPEQGVAWATRQATMYLGEPDDAVALYHFARQQGEQRETRDKMLVLAEQALKAQRRGHAADLYRRLLALSLPTELRAKAQLGLATALERQREGNPANDGPALPLVRAWSQDEGRLWTADTHDGFFFGTQSGQVTCRSSVNGTPRWTQLLSFAPTSVQRWQDLVVIAGPDGVQALRVHDGQPAWSFPAPSRQLRVGSVHAGTPRLGQTSKGFVHVERWDDTLLLLDDCRQFFRLRLDTGEVAWHHTAPAAKMRPLDAGAFSPYLVRVGDALLVQTSAGQPTWLGAKPLGERSRLWMEPPRLIGDRIILAGEGGRVHAFNKRPPHSLRWTYQAPFGTSLTGDLCRLFVKDSVLLALVRRNAGYEWVRLDPELGTALWTIPLSDDLDLASICIGDLSYYAVHGHKLCARSLDNGSLQWEQSLPPQSARWQVRSTKHYLTVCPAEASPEADFFVGFFDPFDSRWLQRLSFPAARGLAEIRLTRSQLLVSVAGKVHGFRPLDAE